MMIVFIIMLMNVIISVFKYYLLKLEFGELNR